MPKPARVGGDAQVAGRRRAPGPPPRHQPLMRAITGTGQSRTAAQASWIRPMNTRAVWGLRPPSVVQVGAAGERLLARARDHHRADASGRARARACPRRTGARSSRLRQLSFAGLSSVTRATSAPPRGSSATEIMPRARPCSSAAMARLELARVGVELADAVGELLHRHRVLVVLPEEGRFVQGCLFDGKCFRLFRGKNSFDGTRNRIQFLQQVRRNRQQVAARQRQDLLGLPEARAHHLRRVAVLLVVVVDASSPRRRPDPRRRGCRPPCARPCASRRCGRRTARSASRRRRRRPPPARTRTAASGCSGCPRAPGARRRGCLPRSLASLMRIRSRPMFCVFIEGNEFPRFLDGSFLIERKPGVHLGGDAPRDVLEDLAAEVDEQAVHVRREADAGPGSGRPARPRAAARDWSWRPAGASGRSPRCRRCRRPRWNASQAISGH